MLKLSIKIFAFLIMLGSYLGETWEQAYDSSEYKGSDTVLIYAAVALRST